MKPLSIISCEVNCQILKPENTFVFVVLFVQETLENIYLTAAVFPPSAGSSAQSPSSLCHLENQYRVVSARCEHPPKPGHPSWPNWTALPSPGRELGLPTHGKVWIGALLRGQLPSVQVKWPGWWGLPLGMSLSKPAIATCSQPAFPELSCWSRQHWSNHHLCVLWGPLVWQQSEQPYSPCGIAYPRGQVSLHWTSVCATLHKIFISRPLPWTQAKLAIFPLSMISFCGLHVLCFKVLALLGWHLLGRL